MSLANLHGKTYHVSIVLSCLNNFPSQSTLKDLSCIYCTKQSKQKDSSCIYCTSESTGKGFYHVSIVLASLHGRICHVSIVLASLHGRICHVSILLSSLHGRIYHVSIVLSCLNNVPSQSTWEDLSCIYCTKLPEKQVSDTPRNVPLTDFKITKSQGTGCPLYSASFSLAGFMKMGHNLRDTQQLEAWASIIRNYVHKRDFNLDGLQG